MPETKSGTLSASDKGKAPAKAARPAAKKAAALEENLGVGLVEHGDGLGRHRVEDGPVPVEGTVVLVTPERG